MNEEVKAIAREMRTHKISGGRQSPVLVAWAERLEFALGRENVSPKPAAIVESAERILMVLIANKTSSQMSVDKKFLIALAKDLATELHKD